MPQFLDPNAVQCAHRFARHPLVFVVAMVVHMVAIGGAAAQSTEPMKSYRQFQHAEQAGQFSQAVRHLERALKIWKEKYGAEHKDVGTLLDNLAGLKKKQGHYNEAVKLYQESIRHKERVLGAAHESVGETWHNLALVYREQGRYTKAEALYKKSLTITEQRLGASHPTVAMILNSHARNYLDQGRYSEAEALLKRSIAIVEGKYGRDHVSMSIHLGELASLYSEQGRLSEAEKLHKRSIAITEKAYGPDHPSVGRKLNNLALLYAQQDRLDQAVALMERSLKILETSYGPDHPKVGTVLDNLALLHRRQKRYAQAIKLLKRSLNIAEKTRGPEHPNVANNLSVLADIFLFQKRYAEAEPLYKRSLSIKEKSLAKNHPDVADDLNSLARLYFRQGRYRDAEPVQRRALAIVENALRPDHPTTQIILRNTADLYEKLGRTKEAAHLRARLSRAAPIGTRNVQLYFATNRRPNRTRTGYANEASPKLNLGRVIVRVPLDQVENRSDRLSQASGLVGQVAAGRLTTAKDLKVVSQKPIGTAAAFVMEAKTNQRHAVNFKNQALVFVHGYNTNYTEAMQRATQMAFDLEFDGVLIPFSWPSRGRPTLVAYLQDLKEAEKSVAALIALLDQLQQHAPQLKLHLIAHSMGNQILLRALNKIAQRKNKPRPNLGEVIAAHPDISPEDFDALTKGFRPIVSGTTLYVNRADTALSVSATIRAKKGRAGNTIRSYAAADAIDTTAMSIDSSLNHDVFVRDPALFADMTRLLLSSTRPPDKRTAQLRAATDKAGGAYWRYENSSNPSGWAVLESLAATGSSNSTTESNWAEKLWNRN